MVHERNKCFRVLHDTMGSMQELRACYSNSAAVISQQESFSAVHLDCCSLSSRHPESGPCTTLVQYMQPVVPRGGDIPTGRALHSQRHREGASRCGRLVMRTIILLIPPILLVCGRGIGLVVSLPSRVAPFALGSTSKVLRVLGLGVCGPQGQRLLQRPGAVPHRGSAKHGVGGRAGVLNACSTVDLRKKWRGMRWWQGRRLGDDAAVRRCWLDLGRGGKTSPCWCSRTMGQAIEHWTRPLLTTMGKATALLASAYLERETLHSSVHCTHPQNKTTPGWCQEHSLVRLPHLGICY